MDVYPRQGKQGGAFCAAASVSLPTYILLNHTDRLQDVLTLAHETGHGINNELMRVKQNALNFGTPTSTAEVASTFMEDFVLEHLAAEADEPTQLAINMLKLNDDISSIFRQVAGYRFEQELHQAVRERGYVPQEQIGEIFTKAMSTYMGPAVEQSPGSQNWWVYWSHFRRYFYVYSYASGLLISKSLQAMVRQDPASISRVKEFLSAGTSDSPKNIFAKLDIHIDEPTFWQRGLDQIASLLDQTEKLAARVSI
jgi:oligoendopeptidase F